MSSFCRIDRPAREQRERDLLSPAACRSVDSRGRARAEDPDPFRTCFERDRDRILHSKAFRRLKHKTQVFINPEGDHVVTRLTHTLQVTQIARSLASALGLNEPLVEAMSLGHEVGHPPFGHTGEDALSPYVEGDWLHAEQSVRVLSVLEPLNLTWEVLDGIRAHSWKIDPPPATVEGMLLRFADRIAYLVHDTDDAMRAGILTASDLPTEALEIFGTPGREWVHGMIHAVIRESMATGDVAMEPESLAAMQRYREFMFEAVYLRPEAKRQAEQAVRILRDLVDYYLEYPEAMPTSYRQPDEPLVTQVIDVVAGMTDRYATRVHDRIFRP
ncbi:MAG: HD domain-containing protein, partial [Acidobacteriota bacterium]|nr:HD domain-containing protein [Acidobacteriota bacterium]